jgi:L-2-hydroxyglutarate oxidase
VSKEWKSSISKNTMVRRVKEFIPKVKPQYFTARGTAGIRTPIITKNGTFLSETLEIQSDNSMHILNYNSPGATGAPVYSAYLVQQLFDAGIIQLDKTQKQHVWDFSKIISSV